MASLTALATMPEMIGRICVAKDESKSRDLGSKAGINPRMIEIGVYGFVFYRGLQPPSVD
jgi:hypothetical protein